MANIAFFARACVPFHDRSLEERPLGGTETGVIYLARALKERGHQVSVFTAFERPPASEPFYLPFRALSNIGPLDAFVALREWQPVLAAVDARVKLLWTGDSYDQLSNYGIGDKRIYSNMDGLLLVSNWHQKTLCEMSGFPQEKAFVLGNGINSTFFKSSTERVRKRLMYSSTPYRGLKFLPPLYLAIKAKHPDAELHIFSGYTVYSGPQGYDAAAELDWKNFKEVLAQLPDCTIHGNILQDRLAREFQKSAVLAYPNIFEETSCISVMEAQAAGCVPVSTNRAALAETVADTGVLIEGEPGTPAYSEAFVDAVDRLFTDDQYFDRLSSRCIERRAKGSDWSDIAERFEDYLSTHGV